MDDREIKMFVQMDDDLPSQRINGMERLREYNLKKDPPRHFRDMASDFESAMELRKNLDEYREANEAAQQRDAAQAREITRLKAELKAALWVKVNWKTIGSIAAVLLVLVAGWWTYQRYWSRSEAVMSGLRAAVATEKWNMGLFEPVARKIAGEPYWLLFEGYIDASSYSDGNGRDVEMRCLNLYATPAQPDSEQYFKPSPRNFLGWIKWPKLAVSCKRAPLQKADK